MTMAFSTAISRLAGYYTRHGFRSTFLRAGQAARRVLFSGREVLLYCDLAGPTLPPETLPSSLNVERKKSAAELSPRDLQEMTSFWNPGLAHRNIKERFGHGASLWLIKFEDRLAGYVWTLQGRTIAPHYFALGQNDVHFFDLYVFPLYRGRAVNWFLITHTLGTLAAEGASRAFSEVAEWNQASLSSFKLTPFHRFGLARKATIFGRTIVCWTHNQSIRQTQKDTGETAATRAATRRGSAVQR